MEGLLQGIKVLDLSSVLAGPMTGTFLAECGARVIKVEPPTGDVTQSWRLPDEPTNRDSAYYAAANRGKTVVHQNLKTAEGQEWLHSMLAEHDVLIQNMKQADLDAMGLSPQVLSVLFPRLVHVRLVGYEFDSSRLAYDVVVQAESGFMSMNGYANTPPARLPVALMDVLASHQMRAAVLGGLYQREQSGKGCYAEVSLLGSGLTALANQGTNALINQKVPRRMGSTHPNIAPYGDLLKCEDGELVLAVGSEGQFQALCDVLNLSSIPSQRQFNSNSNRLAHRTSLMETLNAASSTWKRDALLDKLVRARVPTGALLTVHEALNQTEFRQRYVVSEEGLERLKTSAIDWVLSPRQTED